MIFMLRSGASSAQNVCTTSTSRYVVKHRYIIQLLALLIFGKHMNVLTVHILIVLVMSVWNLSEETDPTFKWAWVDIKFG